MSTAPTSHPASPGDTVLTRLRRETRPSHERAEQLVGMPGSGEDLARILSKFYGFIAPWERAAAPALAPLAVRLAGRSKTPWLARDLAHFGVAADDLPLCTALPRLDTLSRALGSMYVFEGATLGGTLIARHAEQVLGRRDGAGYSFHRSYGPRVGEMWRAFGQVLLDVAAQSRAGEDDIVASAGETFDRLCDWFAHSPPSPHGRGPG